MIFGQRIPPVLAKKPTNLAEWLDVATQHIVPVAQARIRAEVEAHYAEAVQASLRQSRSEFDAHAAALADLGDAAAAGTRFRREHLTTQDPDALANIAWLQICFGLLWVSALITLHSLPDPNAKPGPLGVLFILFFFFVVCPVTALSLRKFIMRSRKIPTQRLIFMLLFITCLNLGAFLTTDPGGHSGRHLSWWSSAIIFPLMAASSILYLLRFRKKLLSAREDDLPPLDPAATA